MAGAPMSSDYRRVERAIRFLEERHQEQPSLGEVAKVLGLSPFHCQRLFQRWAGLSPKAFLQAVTLAHAKVLLDQSRSLLESSLALGLSGPSRLHDLFVQLEAMTPGEYKARGDGLLIQWAVHATPLGRTLFAATERGLCGLTFVEGNVPSTCADLERRWPGATFRRDSSWTQPYARELEARFSGRAPAPLALLLKGRPLQLKVWDALLRVPEGALLSYGTLAKEVGAPNAARAVGTAVGQNPIGYFIPCHRVIQASGAVGNYRWGPARKRALLAVELGRQLTQVKTAAAAGDDPQRPA